jgi:hypothetical protein
MSFLWQSYTQTAERPSKKRMTVEPGSPAADNETAAGFLFRLLSALPHGPMAKKHAAGAQDAYSQTVERSCLVKATEKTSRIVCMMLPNVRCRTS